MYRELKEGEVIQEGDEAYDDQADSWRLTGMRGTVGGEIGKWKPRFRRPLPAATFEEPVDFEPEFIIGKEPVDEVIYPNADLPEMNALDVVDGVAVRPKVSEVCRFNPYTGTPRDSRDIESDPKGILIRDPRVPLKACKISKPNKYSREIAPGVSVDVYDVLKAFNVTNSALQHLIKKALAVGIRGHKDASEDYQDIIDSAIRAKELG